MSDRDGLIATGCAAARSGSWREAFDALEAADVVEPLEADELEVLGWAAHFSARPEAAIAVRQRAFASVRDADPTRAALIALHIALVQLGRDALAVGAGWVQQATNLLADQGECEAATWLAWAQALMASELGETEFALAAADEVIGLAARIGVPDVEALAGLLKGQILTSQGHAEEGARLIDPVMALAVGGMLGPLAAAWVYCGTISTCASTGDLERAWEWTNEVGRCGLSGGSDFPGDCRMHRAELLRVRGEWAKAELEMASVCDDLGTWHSGHVATAHYELGELSLRRGDLTAAAGAFAYCRELGHTPLPGMASLELASGHVDTAVALVRAELATTRKPLVRSRLLPVAVEAQLAAGQIDDAREAADELRALSGSWPAALHQARAAHAEGAVALAIADLANARRCLAEAVEWWRRVPAPYDEAISRVLLALAEEPAARVMHLEAALETFARLGAVLDAQRVTGHLGREVEAERVALALMFTDIEGSTTTLAELGDAAWLKVLRRHDSTLREIFGRYSGDEFLDTGDGFFVGFPTADAALDCALDIQRNVEDVRVRIGVHFTVASRDQSGLSGRGVHEAARISALGSGGDVVVSITTLQHATKPYPTRGTRTVGLKGLPGDMQIAYLTQGEQP